MQVTDATAAPPIASRVIPYIVAAVALIAGVLVLQPYAVGVFHDDGAYAILAKSIAEGRGFRFLQLPGDPAAIHYPPAYPLLLSIVWRLAPAFPGNVTTLLAANAVFLALVAYGVFQLCTRMLGWTDIQAAIAAVVGTLSYPLMLLTGLLLSEPMFIAALIFLIPVAERMVASEMRPRWRFLPFGVACAGLALIRTHGLAVVAAVVLVLAWRRRWREIAWCLAGVVVALFPWQVWQAVHGRDLPEALRGSYGSYIAWFAEGLRSDGFLARTLTANSREVWSTLGDRFSPTEIPAVEHIAALIAFAAACYGGWRIVRRAPAMVWCLLIYMAIVMLWPYSPWRFVFAIWPLVIVLVGEAARAAFESARRRRPHGMVLAALLVVVGTGIAMREVRAVVERAWWIPARVAAQQTVPGMMWIVRNTKEASLIASEVPELVYLYTGRRSVPVMPFTASEYGVSRSRELDRANVVETIRQLPVDYVVTISPPMRDAVKGIVPTPALLDSTATYAAFRTR